MDVKATSGNSLCSISPKAKMAFQFRNDNSEVQPLKLSKVPTDHAIKLSEELQQSLKEVALENYMAASFSAAYKSGYSEECPTIMSLECMIGS